MSLLRVLMPEIVGELRVTSPPWTLPDAGAPRDASLGPSVGGRNPMERNAACLPRAPLPQVVGTV